jgi:hypothetical protein
VTLAVAVADITLINNAPRALRKYIQTISWHAAHARISERTLINYYW